MNGICEMYQHRLRLSARIKGSATPQAVNSPRCCWAPPVRRRRGCGPESAVTAKDLNKNRIGATCLKKRPQVFETQGVEAQIGSTLLRCRLRHAIATCVLAARPADADCGQDRLAVDLADALFHLLAWFES